MPAPHRPVAPDHKADVVIIGGGVNGCSLAYQLSKRKMKVILCEKNYLCSGATGRCGAGIRQQWSTRENTELAINSIKIFERLEKDLGKDIGLRQGGYLIIFHDKWHKPQVHRHLSLLGEKIFPGKNSENTRQKKNNLPLLQQKTNYLHTPISNHPLSP